MHLIDIALLAVIFFGHATVGAILQYWQLRQAGMDAPTELHFDTIANAVAIGFELVSLVLAWLYLRWRRFDFTVLNFSIKNHALLWVPVLILCGGAAADIYSFLHTWIFPPNAPALVQEPVAEAAASSAIFHRISLSLLFFALLNGFYEELFFLGLVFAVPRAILPLSVLFSLGVRFVFHIYQGLAAAAVVTTLGLVFLLFRRRISSLTPFMLAHSFFDIFGLSLAFLFLL